MKRIKMSEELIEVEADLNSHTTCAIACALKEGYGVDWGDVEVHATTSLIKFFEEDPLDSLKKTIKLNHTEDIKSFISSFDNETIHPHQYEGGLNLVINEDEGSIDFDEGSKKKYVQGFISGREEDSKRMKAESLALEEKQNEINQ